MSGGTEAISRTLRALWQERRSDHNFAILSIDGRNAFNTVDRAQMLNEVRLRCPELARFAYFLYARPALLYFGSRIIYSRAGTHQGCPLGPLFFNLRIHPMLEALRALRRPDAAGDLLMLAATRTTSTSRPPPRRPLSRECSRSSTGRMALKQAISAAQRRSACRGSWTMRQEKKTPWTSAGTRATLTWYR